MRLSGASSGAGLFREELLGSSPAGTMGNLFEDLRRITRGKLIGEAPDRRTQATQLFVDQGHGRWDLYRLDHDVYVVATDCIYHTAREEWVPGEGRIEFSLRLSGQLTLHLPGHSEPLQVVGPRLLTLYQPPDAAISERVEPNQRDSVVSLYCKPSYLQRVLRRNALADWPQLSADYVNTVWYQSVPLSPSLVRIACELLDSPYQGGTRLLHAEAKVLELLCEILSADGMSESRQSTALNDESVLRRLDRARRILASQFDPAPRNGDVARAVGMSASTLERAFAARFGLSVDEYRRECRMRHALELLRRGRLSISEVSLAVGYHHHTSFTAAFRDYFGFLPRDARKNSL